MMLKSSSDLSLRTFKTLSGFSLIAGTKLRLLVNLTWLTDRDIQRLANLTVKQALFFFATFLTLQRLDCSRSYFDFATYIIYLMYILGNGRQR